MPTAPQPAVVVLTGAGISADSGLATFRDAGGLWEGHRVEEVATPAAWRANKELVWRFYQLRRRALSDVEPNPAHFALARLEQTLTERGLPFTLITQNVDNLHERAGSSPLHMHGELAQLRCERCHERIRDLERTDPETFLHCELCAPPAVALRPDIVWFGEMPFHLDTIQDCLTVATHFVSIGTSGQVYPAAGFLDAARQYGAQTIVNSLDEPSNIDPRDRFMPGRAATVVPQLVDELIEALAPG